VWLRITNVVIAIVEMILVSSWIVSFIDAGPSHLNWYVGLPIWFLIIPAAASIAETTIRAEPGRWRRMAVSLLSTFLLVANLFGFGVYGALSGGGV
jgi:hypothetical protein